LSSARGGQTTAFGRETLETVWVVDHVDSPALLIMTDNLPVAAGHGESVLRDEPLG